MSATLEMSARPTPQRSAAEPEDAARGIAGGRADRLGWPLMFCFAGIPLWWVLGVLQIAFIAASAAMFVYLARSRSIRAPRGLGIWLLFLVWMFGGLFTMQVTAPATIPGQSLGRYAVFGYRGLWYVMGTIALLYVLNTRKDLATQRIGMAISWMFVALVGGGLLGVLLPTLEFPSALEVLLPGVISNNGFVQQLIHPQVAQLQDFLGYVEPRPSAPFAFSNEWGLNLVCTVPFFVVAWWKRGGLFRLLMPFVLAVAMIPIVSSLNRGLWLALVVITVYVVVRSLLHGRAAVLFLLIIGVMVAAALIAVTPLGDLLQDRINTPHSNQGRANLSLQTVQSALEGSPVIGFGTTRDVAGNFNSIAGGESERCPACSPPPLGTQGQLWQVLFSFGLIGVFLYCAFFVTLFLRYVRNGGPYAVAAQCTLIALLVTIPVYNAVGPAVFVGLLALGIMARDGAPTSERSFRDLLDPVRRNVAFVVALALLGAAAGATVQLARGSTAIATQAVVVPSSNFFGVAKTRPLTLDSEARLVMSEAVLSQVAETVDASSTAEVGASMGITAEPNSDILKISYRNRDTRVAAAAAQQAAASYLAYREELIVPIQQANVERLEQQQETLSSSYTLSARTVSGADPPVNPQLLETAAKLRQASGSSFGELSNLREGSESFGQTLGTVKVQELLDPLLIRVGSGFMLGLLAGLVLIWYSDGMWGRLGTDPERQLGVDLPVVAQSAAPARGGELTESTSDAARAIRAYRPLCGIVADTAPAAQALATALSPVLSDKDHNAGNRIVIIAAERSTPRSVRRLHRMCQEAGQQPVGLIVALEGRSPAQE